MLMVHTLRISLDLLHVLSLSLANNEKGSVVRISFSLLLQIRWGLGVTVTYLWKLIEFALTSVLALSLRCWCILIGVDP